MKSTAKVILLNGVGSSGKSTIARALQDILDEPYLHVQMDAFLDMLPERLQDDPRAFSYERSDAGGAPVVAIAGGPIGQRLLVGMRHAIAAMAGQGNNLIVDDVTCHGEMPEYVRLLSPYRLYLVGIFAPLEILGARERERGDRMIGLARWQYDRVHRDVRYDLEVDTSAAAPLDCARLIKDKFQL
jgi:chloramphenicol 3-O phosphotransferase